MTTQQLRWYGVPEGEAELLMAANFHIWAKRMEYGFTFLPVMPSGVVDKLMAGKITYCGGLAKYHKRTR